MRTVDVALHTTLPAHWRYTSLVCVIRCVRQAGGSARALGEVKVIGGLEWIVVLEDMGAMVIGRAKNALLGIKF